MFTIILVLSLIGILETSYLIASRKKQKEPVCVIGGSCNTVLESKYNKTLGIHNDILGLIFYISILVLMTTPQITTAILPINVAFAINIGILLFGIIPLSIIGALSSLYFTYLQFFKIKSWCFWCLMSAINTWLILAMIIFGFA